MEENIEEGIVLPALPQIIEQSPDGNNTDVWHQDLREDVSDLTGMTEEDKAWAFGTYGVDRIDEPEELDDLFEVTDEDIMGDDEPEQPSKQTKYRIRPVRRISPSTSMGGMQY